MRVKGTVIIDLVKTVRAMKDRNWATYLTPADFQIVKSIVVASAWYPGDTFWRLSWAVSKELGQNRIETSFEFGRASARSYLAVYKRILVPGDAAVSIKNCVNLWESFYDVQGARYRKMEVEAEPRRVRVRAWDYPDMIIPEARASYFHGLAGYFQEIAERASGVRVHHSIRDYGDSFEMGYSWV